MQEESVLVLRFDLTTTIEALFSQSPFSPSGPLEDFYFISLCKNTIRDLLTRSLSVHNTALFSIDAMLCSDSPEVFISHSSSFTPMFGRSLFPLPWLRALPPLRFASPSLPASQSSHLSKPQNSSSCGCLVSLSMSSGFVRVVVCGRISFLFKAE